MNIAPWAVGAFTPTPCGKVTWPSLDGPTDGGGKSLRRGGRSLSMGEHLSCPATCWVRLHALASVTALSKSWGLLDPLGTCQRARRAGCAMGPVGTDLQEKQELGSIQRGQGGQERFMRKRGRVAGPLRGRGSVLRAI